MREGSAVRGYLLLVVALAALFFGLVWALNQADRFSVHGTLDQDLVFVPSASFVKRASLGFDNLVADLLWLRTVRYVFREHKGPNRFKWLKEMLQIVSEMDPHFCQVYWWGGGWLYMDADRPEDGIEFLKKGLKYCPDKWLIPYHLGKCYREKLFDEKRATFYFEKAYHTPGAPKALMLAVAAGYERQGLFDKAQRLWREAQRTTADPNIAQAAAKKVRDIQATIETMAFLDRQIEAFQQKFGRIPDTLEELLLAGLITKVPAPAIRGRFQIDKTAGKVRYVYIPERRPR